MGKSRWIVVALASITAAAIAIAIAKRADDMWLAVALLVSSLAGFHLLAFFTHERVRLWKAVDYVWVLTTFVAIVIALTNIHENERSRLVDQVLDSRRRAYDSLIYALNTTLTNDCTDLPSRSGMWTRSPEPVPGECDRVRHFLPQIEAAAASERSWSDLNAGDFWATNLRQPGVTPAGSWAGLYAEAERFARNGDEVRASKSALESSPSSFLAPITKGTELKVWYFALAILLGLRLSRVTVDLAAAGAKPPATAPTAETPRVTTIEPADRGREAGTRDLARSTSPSSSDTPLRDQAVLAFLAENPGARQRTITAELRVGKRDLRACLARLIAASRARATDDRHGRRYYAVVDAGARRASRPRGSSARRGGSGEVVRVADDPESRG